MLAWHVPHSTNEPTHGMPVCTGVSTRKRKRLKRKVRWRNSGGRRKKRKKEKEEEKKCCDAREAAAVSKGSNSIAVAKRQHRCSITAMKQQRGSAAAMAKQRSGSATATSATVKRQRGRRGSSETAKRQHHCSIAAAKRQHCSFVCEKSPNLLFLSFF